MRHGFVRVSLLVVLVVLGTTAVLRFTPKPGSWSSSVSSTEPRSRSIYARVPSVHSYRSADGVILNSVFEGIQPTPQQAKARWRGISSPPHCDAKTGALSRIARFVGLGGVVHAQASCTNTNCNQCLMTSESMDCGSYCGGVGDFDSWSESGMVLDDGVEDDGSYLCDGAGGCINECEQTSCTHPSCG